MWYPAVRAALFALDPERAHQLALEALRLSGRRAPMALPATPVECMGLRFANRIGLAAGFDKNGEAIDGLGRLGFGFVEIGTVTPRPQKGQSKPRLFRFPATGALVNRLGFPNLGAEVVAGRLRRRRYRGIVGVNIGKNADTPLSRAIDDYIACLRMVRPVADYVAINVSSPNTSGLRSLQEHESLQPLLSGLIEDRDRCAAVDGHRPPLLLKVSPDLSSTDLRGIAALLKSLPMDGVIATNTTTDRSEGRAHVGTQGGGLSGALLRPIALRVVRELRQSLGDRFPIIGCGGIDSALAARAMRDAGADLIQLYTGLIYRGPGLVGQCIRAST